MCAGHLRRARWIATGRARDGLARMTPAQRAATPAPCRPEEVAGAVVGFVCNDDFVGRVKSEADVIAGDRCNLRVGYVRSEHEHYLRGETVRLALRGDHHARSNLERRLARPSRRVSLAHG